MNIFSRTSMLIVLTIVLILVLEWDGQTLAQVVSCTDNAACSTDEYCATDLGSCGGEGTCSLRPDACTTEVHPVCGCDMKTYNNACEAATAGVNVAHPGSCLNMSFDPQTQTATANQLVSVDILISQLQADTITKIVGAFDLDIQYDKDILLPIDITFGPDLNGTGASLQDFDLSNPGIIDLAEVSLRPDAGLELSQQDSLRLATLTFEIIGPGTSPLSFVFDHLNDMKGRDALMLLPEVNGGSIVVDSDGDGVIDSDEMAVLDLCIFADDKEVKLEENARVECSVRSDGEKVELKKNSEVLGEVISRSDEVKVEESSMVSGNVTAGGKIEIKKKAEVGGNVTSGDEITLKENSHVGGDAIAAGSISLESGATVSGSINEGASVPPIEPLPFPSVSVSASGPKVTVAKNNTIDLSPGSYEKLDVKEGATLNLSAGTYVFERIQAHKNASLNFDVDSGSIVVKVEKQVDLHERVVMSSTGTASDILILVAGSHVQLHKDGTYLGTFIAPEGHIDVHQGSEVTGALYADKVQLKKDTSVIGDPAVDLFVEQFVLP